MTTQRGDLGPLGLNRRRLAFALQLVQGRLNGADRLCPYCGSPEARRLYRRHLLMDVLRCHNCGLRYRYPKATPAANEAYYQRRYEEFETSTLTQLPDRTEARTMAAAGFAGTAWDESERLELMHGAGCGGRLLDYGCSWGYFTAQARRAGFDAVGFEISKRRAEFGREALGLDILDAKAALQALPNGSFDTVYSSHVLEHLPDLERVFSLFYRLLAPTGRLILFLPNAGGRTARIQGNRWGGISEVHTLGFDASFFRHNLPPEGFAVQCFSDPYGDFSQRFASDADGEECHGDELLVIARKP